MRDEPNHGEILGWLRETNPDRLNELWFQADQVRKQHVGDAIHLRGLIEISNHCVRACAYCGLHAGNRLLARYRMETDEILSAARQAVQFGYGSVVLQAGEDYALTRERMAALIRSIKHELPLAVTLSLGERSDADLAAWREAGADRYLLRFETSDDELFRTIHPGLCGGASNRLPMLGRIKALGYETGSGIMLGLPGQSYESVAWDIGLFRELELDMIGVGPYLPHPETPLGSGELRPRITEGEQIPGDELMVYKAIALTRLVRPDANIPSTTALATLNRGSGRELGLRRGANVLMPNLTPPKYRQLYQIYPNKACLFETGHACDGCLRARISALGRTVGRGPGGRARTGKFTIRNSKSETNAEFKPRKIQNHLSHSLWSKSVG